MGSFWMSLKKDFNIFLLANFWLIWLSFLLKYVSETLNTNRCLSVDKPVSTSTPASFLRCETNWAVK